MALDQIDGDADGPDISLEDADSTDMQQGSRDSSDNVAEGVAATFNAQNDQF
ncbi:MAG: hypothetical protein WA418_17175 [Bradyrhizobium sp.]